MAGAAILALLMNAPQVSADDDIVIFGGEFEDGSAPSARKKVEQPTPKPPVEKPAPPPKVEQPQEKPLPKPERVEPQDTPPTQPLERTEEPAPQQSPEEIKEKLLPPTQPLERTEEPAPIEKPTVEPAQPVEIERPFERPKNIPDVQDNEPTVILPTTDTERSDRRYFPSSNYSAPPSTNLKTLKQRFIRLAVDDTYTYYLDKSSVQWKRVPYLANDYMADVWVRMIEREPKQLSDDMASYGAENFRAEVALAREQGYQYSPEDLKVLRSQAYVLEHYYLRPKTKQIQFLCELEVFGRPQNAINERAYDYQNWEYLVPGSIESAIYEATIKIIGKSKATERGHMTFADMLDEYARIALN